ncbi:hypothetical protein C8T65DRAFT_832284 [Cerioporus squamosus]|nr:hypothetical protein C8T65DRAFT_832284 [Cerioporus squamosus]
MSTKPTIVDNNRPGVEFYINPQYVNVTDQISAKAYDYVQTAQLSAYNQSLADITTPRWSFSYAFTGTRISLFGVVIPYISGPLPAAQYAVDGTSLNTSTVPNTTRTLTGVNFYTSEYFPSGPHVLTVNVTTATSDGPYLFDYLAIDTTDPPASSSSSSSSVTRSSSQTSSSASPSGSGSALHAVAASKSAAPTGAIVGGVVGGVILLAAIAIGAWWLWKKHRTYDQSSYSYARTGQYDGPDPHIEAYTYSSPDASSSHTPGEGAYSESLYSGAVAPMMATSFHRPSLPASAPQYSAAAPVSSKASLAQSRQQSLPSQYSESPPPNSEYSISQPPRSQYSISQPHSLEASHDALVPAPAPVPAPLSGAARKAAEARLELRHRNPQKLAGRTSARCRRRTRHSQTALPGVCVRVPV